MPDGSLNIGTESKDKFIVIIQIYLVERNSLLEM